MAKLLKINRKKYFLFLGSILLLVIVNALYQYFTRPQMIPVATKLASINLTPEISNDFGMDKNSKILVSLKNGSNFRQFKNNLKISPEVSYSIAKKNNNQAEISFDEPLRENKVYKFSLTKDGDIERDYSWAYQVRAPFQVISSIPADKAKHVKKNTGIEFTTNREGFDNPKNHISIEPLINFDVEENGRLIIVKPNQSDMQNGKIYKVTLRKELMVKVSKETLGEDYIIQFATEESSNPTREYYNFAEKFNEGSTTTKPTLDIYGYDPGTNIQLSVYKFTTPDSFIVAYNETMGYLEWGFDGKIDTEKLKKYEPNKISNMVLPIIDKGYRTYVELPEPLPNGYYIISGKFGDTTSGTTFQSTNAISFTSLSMTKSLLWLNNLSTKAPLINSEVSLHGIRKLGNTNNDGVLLIDTPAEIKEKLSEYSSDSFFVVTVPSSLPIVIPVSGEGYVHNTEPEKYISFISTDKPIYQKSDSIHFWGVLRRRSGEKVKNIRVDLVRGLYDDDKILYEKVVPVSEFGTFSNKIDTEDLAPGSYYLRIMQEDKIIDSKNIQIATYVKPAYKLKLETDKEAIHSGQEVQISLKAEFYDGTPVTQTEFRYSAEGTDMNKAEGIIKTNGNGEAAFKLRPTRKDNGNYPMRYSAQVVPVNAEEGDISGTAEVTVFVSNLILSDSVKGDQLILGANRVILDSINYIGAPAKNQKIEGTIYWEEDVKTEAGEVYNSITKLMEKKYNYSRVSHAIKTFNIVTDADGKANYNLKDLEKNKNYSVALTASDEQNRAVSIRTYYFRSDITNNGVDSIWLEDAANPEGKEAKSYKVNEKVKFQLKKNSGPLPENSKYLFLVAQSGIKEFTMRNKPEYERTFGEIDIPNISTLGIWFDGAHLFESNSLWTRFDKEEKKLNIKVTKNKEKYQPRDKVVLDFQVTNSKGKGELAELNVGIIDDALNAISEIGDNPKLLDSLYAALSDQIKTRVSHKIMPPEDGGKGGGGNGDFIRSDLIDLAYYGAVKTDSNGKARIEFKLPDNITSFAVTTYGITKNLEAGQDGSNLIVTKPMFVDATINKDYLENDEAFIKLRAFGQNNNAVFSAESKSLGISKQDLKPDAAGNVYVNLGKLGLGEHKIVVSAKTKDNTDRLEKKITVKKSYFSYIKQTYTEIENELKEIKTSDSGRTEIMVMDRGKGEALSYLYNLYSQYGERSDQVVTRNIASKLLREKFQVNNVPIAESISNYQAGSGGIQLLPYGGESLELSAKLADLGVDVDRTELIYYFENSLIDKKSDADRKATALYGLSALNQPYLAKLHQVAKNSLTLDQACMISLGMIRLGDSEGAREVYLEKIVPSLVKSGLNIRAKTGEGDQLIKSTANAAIVASELGTDEAYGLRRFFRTSQMKDDLIVMEEALIARSLTEKPDVKSSFSYQIGDKKVTKVLKPGGRFNLSLTEKEAKQIKFNRISGELGVVSTYWENKKPEELSGKIGIARKYLRGGKQTNEFKEGDLIEIVLTPKVNEDGIYIIEDYLPSGLKLFTGLQQFSKENTIDKPVLIDGQKVKFIYWNDRVKREVRYKARVVSKGSFKADSAVIMKALDTAQINLTPESSITIK